LNKKNTIFDGDFADNNLLLCYVKENLQQNFSLAFVVACPDSVYTAQGFWHTLRQGRRT
jgi:hypothetical protein